MTILSIQAKIHAHAEAVYPDPARTDRQMLAAIYVYSVYKGEQHEIITAVF